MLLQLHQTDWLMAFALTRSVAAVVAVVELQFPQPLPMPEWWVAFALIRLVVAVAAAVVELRFPQPLLMAVYRKDMKHLVHAALLQLLVEVQVELML